MLYRIITENKNLKKIEPIVNKHFDGYIVLRGLWYRRGKSEQCLIIEIVHWDGSVSDIVDSIAVQIKEINAQDSVLVQQIHEDHEFI